MKTSTKFFYLTTLLLSLLVISCAKDSSPTDPVKDTSPPQVQITFPANNAQVSGVVDVQMSAVDDNAVTKVEVYINGTLKTTIGASPWTYSWDTGPYSGACTIYAKAYDAANNVGQSTVISVTKASVVNQPPNAPSAPSPAHQAVNQGLNIILSWTCTDPDAGDSLVYDVYFGLDATPVTVVSTGQGSSSYDPPSALLTSTTYYWKIIAKDKAGLTASGTIWSFTTAAPGSQPPDAPSAPSPAHQAVDQGLDVILSWTCADHDAGDSLVYDVYFGTANPPTTVVSAGQGSTSYDHPQALLNSTTYYWKIVAEDEQGLSTAGNIWSFTTVAPANRQPSAPTNPAPADQATNQGLNVILNWTCSDPDVGDLLVYDVYFGTANPPTAVVSTGQDSASYDPPQALLASTTYYWKIVAEDKAGLSTAGNIWSFTTAPPGNQPPNPPTDPVPADKAIDQPVDVNLSWTCSDPDGNADTLSYEVYFGTAVSPPLVWQGSAASQYDLPILSHSTTYYWKIVAKDNRGHFTTGSIWSFTTEAQGNQPPNSPANPTPADQAVKQPLDVNLSWTCSDPENDPLTYDIYFGTSASPPPMSQGQSNSSYDPGELKNNTKYNWKVKARDNNGNETDGIFWSFTTSNAAPSAPANPSPADMAIDQPIDANLSWTCSDPENDALTYDIYFGTSSPPALVSTGQGAITYDCADLEYSTTYYWKVVAKDVHSNSTNGEEWQFTTVAPLPGATKDVVLSGVTFTFAWIPPGNFMMGSPEGEVGRWQNEAPVHRVIFASGFWMMTTEITQKQWVAVMGSNPAEQYDGRYGVGDDHPVYFVSWDSVQTFEAKLGGSYRLPSESEWEYACRAGTTTRFYWGDDPNYTEIGKYAWFSTNSQDITHPVGSKLPNAWGLYDMSGSILEWCEDDYHANYTGAPNDGSPWLENPRTDSWALRGGGWYFVNSNQRSATRFNRQPKWADAFGGFRLVFR